MTKIKVICGTEWCGDCTRTKKYLDERGIPYAWIDTVSSAEGQRR